MHVNRRIRSCFNHISGKFEQQAHITDRHTSSIDEDAGGVCKRSYSNDLKAPPTLALEMNPSVVVAPRGWQLVVGCSDREELLGGMCQHLVFFAVCLFLLQDNVNLFTISISMPFLFLVASDAVASY
jgi:hypothetical protein